MIRTLSFASILLAACAAQGPSLQPGNDELAGETGDGDAAKADAAHDTFGYLVVHKNADPGNPLWGPAYNLSRANRTSTMCFDKQYHASCDVHDVVWGAHGLSQRAIDQIEAALDGELAGTKSGAQVLVKGTFKSYTEFTAFEPSEIWLAQLDSGNDDGTFVQVFDRGIRCITAPCPTFEELKLNSTKSAAIEGIDYNDASDDVQNRAYEATTTTGVIVAGTRVTSGSGARAEVLRSAHQVYLPVK